MNLKRLVVDEWRRLVQAGVEVMLDVLRPALERRCSPRPVVD